MKEQNEKEQEKQNNEEKPMKKKKVRVNGEKKFYLLTAIGCALALVAIVVVAVAASVNGNVDEQAGIDPDEPGVTAPLPDDDHNNDDEQVVVTPEGMMMPLETVTVLNEYGFYHNKTLNCYYEHAGVDFVAAAGTQVLAVDDGIIESIYTGDLLLGTEITVKHDDGLKSVYRFVNQVEGLKAGDSIKKGQVIATVAEANGNEYKEGAHLHFEILKEGASVDPAVYLTLEEK